MSAIQNNINKQNNLFSYTIAFENRNITFYCEEKDIKNRIEDLKNKIKEPAKRTRRKGLARPVFMSVPSREHGSVKVPFQKKDIEHTIESLENHIKYLKPYIFFTSTIKNNVKELNDYSKKNNNDYSNNIFSSKQIIVKKAISGSDKLSSLDNTGLINKVINIVKLIVGYHTNKVYKSTELTYNLVKLCTSAPTSWLKGDKNTKKKQKEKFINNLKNAEETAQKIMNAHPSMR